MKTLLSAICLLALIASGASADVLWDQSNIATLGDGFLNMASTTCNMFSGNTKLHTASDVTFATNSVITSVTIYETPGNGNAAFASSAYLWIAPKNSALPTTSSDMVNNAANLVTITSAYVVINGVDALAITASGLNINVDAGDFWVSLTPVHNLGVYPYSVHCFSADGVVGDPTATISACAVNSDWLYAYDPDMYDCALMIEGTESAVPTEDAQWGGIKALYR